jgi:hypothetical protein
MAWSRRDAQATWVWRTDAPADVLALAELKGGDIINHVLAGEPGGCSRRRACG